METGELAQATIAIIEWSWDLEEIIWHQFLWSESIINTIFTNPIWSRLAIIIFFLRIVALIRVIKDANARSSSFRFHLLSALIIIAFTPIFWLLLYIAIRPQWWKWDKTPRRDTTFQQIQICTNCSNFNQINNAYCTNCWECLQNTCHECQNKYSNNYSYCPNCWAPRIED